MPPEDDDTLELTEELNPQDEGEDQDAEAEAEEADGESDGDQETVISFADEQADDSKPGENENAVIRRMRQELKEKMREIDALRKAAPAAPTIEVGEKPTLAALNYDEDAYEAAVDKWRERKAAAEAEKARAEEQSRTANEAWQADLQSYRRKQEALGLDDFEEAEETIKSALNQVQQAVIVKSADDPAAFIYALSKSGAKMTELAKIQDPIKMAAAVARMEGAVKVVKKRKAPAIDRPQQGSARPPIKGDKAKQLEKLEAAAEKTGDRTEVVRFKKANGL